MSNSRVKLSLKRLSIMGVTSLLLFGVLACNVLPTKQISSLLRDWADKLESSEYQDQEILQGEAEASGSQSQMEQIGNSNAEEECREYYGLIVYRKSTRAQNGLVNEIIIADDRGNEVMAIPGENGPLVDFDDPAWSPNHCRIVFSAQINNNRNLYSMDPDGSNIIQLTNAPGFEQHADWSPDGSKIVYVVGTVTETQAQSGVESTSQEQSGAVVPTQAIVPQKSGAVVAQPSAGVPQSGAVVAQEGAVVAQSGSDQQSGAAEANQGDTGSALLTGKQTVHIWVMNADGSDQHLLTDVNDFLEDPEWSQDGDQVVFSCKNPGNPPANTLGGICVIDADGKNVKLLTPEDKWSYLYPTWSPDGKQISFYTNAFDAEPAFAVIDADGSGLKKVRIKNVDEPSSQFKKWSPDGKRIIFDDRTTTNISGKIIADHIFILDLKSNTITPLTTTESGEIIERFPDW